MNKYGFLTFKIHSKTLKKSIRERKNNKEGEKNVATACIISGNNKQ